ncbi:UNVERIFIED_CONTAM: hypothetical protein Slati_4182000 [Sesamum latifolium]|uniref:Uncharacterized protein n=1 Tax=Sesamum latifolium TaxID=2727402 RepID=A0AAW2TD30_9LAMI
MRFEEDFQDPGDETPYGLWLRDAVSTWGSSRKNTTAESHHQYRRADSNPVRGQTVFGEFRGCTGQAMSSFGRGKGADLEDWSWDVMQRGQQIETKVCSGEQTRPRKQGSGGTMFSHLSPLLV